MAVNINFFSVLLVVLGTSTGIISIPAAKADGEVKEAKISVYVHDIFGGPSPTDLILVGMPGKTWNYTQFGTVAVVDDVVTEGPNLTSPAVGRLQGMYYTTSLDGLRIGASFSLVFTNEAYNGSTIQILGNADQFDFVTEYSVGSGTGKFRYAKGYASLEILSYDPSIIYTLYRINATILHY